ncbi:hypothetical protein GCM10017044_15720 [Kordiimonas sediminis]|uniref:Uncharacterized protein n=1 Tax=Kordiimonas sediminis TaxID=1735581 RepID=A0A919ASW0_9PROT|nr:hypothetical protein GCM10017044_15720 [Kordiimonas sediminis]
MDKSVWVKPRFLRISANLEPTAMSIGSGIIIPKVTVAPRRGMSRQRKGDLSRKSGDFEWYNMHFQPQCLL